MGEDGERKGRFPKRTRVTLKFESPPLLLPGEQPPAEPAPNEPAPNEPAPNEPAANETPAEPAERRTPDPAPGDDAWSRQRSAPTRRSSPSIPVQPEEEDGGVLDLVDRRSRPSTPTIDLADEMTDRYALGDYTAALLLAELIVGRVPEHESASRIAKSCRERLGQLYLSRLGALHRVPRVAVDAAEVRWLGLDHRAAFLLSRIDGDQTLSDVIDVSGMPRLEALKTLAELLDMGAIAFDD